MRKVLFFAVALIVMSMGLYKLSAVANSIVDQSAHKGAQPYMPSKLEWLSIELNSAYHSHRASEQGYVLNFLPLDRQDAVLLYVRYGPKVDQQTMNMGIEAAREVFRKTLKSHHWDSWVNLREDVRMQPS